MSIQAKSDPLVPIDKAMGHRQAFPESCGLFDQVAIVTRLRPQQCRFDQAEIANTRSSPEQTQLLRMNINRVFEGQVIHWLLGQRLIDARPAAGTLRVQLFHRRIDG